MSKLPNKASIDCDANAVEVSFQDLSINSSSTSMELGSSIITVSATSSSAGSKLSVDCELGEKEVENVERGKNSLSSASYCTSGDVNEASFRRYCPSKPHKGNDLRWDAIQCVLAKDGQLGLGHFRLLKKLGFGDIGSVYLAELRGMKCMFAMKVMDKGMLAGRKKLVRAQTEREILGLLDHPFLPTLYSHFETEKFSCLLMEFCSGGDLHLLRQSQPGRHFTEQAARLALHWQNYI